MHSLIVFKHVHELVLVATLLRSRIPKLLRINIFSPRCTFAFMHLENQEEEEEVQEVAGE